MAANAVWLLACLKVALTITAKVPDNSVGYSRIVVASPGVRKYTYDIAHDPQGRDFSIHFNPLDTEMDLDNYLQDHNHFPQPEAKYYPQSVPHYNHIIPVNEDFDDIDLNIKHPTHEEMEKSSKAIQNVHAAYSKKPVQPHPPMNLEEFDLGIMGYGDFMDSHHDEPRANPQFYPIQNAPLHNTQIYKQNYNVAPIKFYQQNKVPYAPPKKLTYPEVRPNKALVNAQSPSNYGVAPLNLPKALFMPAYDEGRLKGLADKAYSKVFMAHGYANPVPRFYPKTGQVNERIDMSKTLFVPVMIIPSTAQSVVDKDNIERSGTLFEPKRIVKKKI